MSETNISDEEIAREFAAFHHRESPLRALAEAGRHGIGNPFQENKVASRSGTRSNEYMLRFKRAVDGLFGR